MTEEERKARLKEIREAVRDSTRNTLNLPQRIVWNRVMNRGWTLEDALNTPLMNRSQAGHRAAKNPNWRNFTITEPKHDRPMARR